MYQLDTIDTQIRSNAKRTPSSHISAILRPLQGQTLTDEGLRIRVKKLAKAGYLKLEKTPRGKVLVFPTE